MILSRTTRGSLHPICGVNSSNSGELLLFPRTSSPPHRYTIGEKFTRRGEHDGVRLLLQGPLRVSLTRVIFPAASPSLLPFFPLHSFSRPLPCCSFPLIWPSHFSFLCHLMSSAFAEWGRGFLFVYTKIRHEKKKKTSSAGCARWTDTHVGQIKVNIEWGWLQKQNEGGCHLTCRHILI